MLNFIEAYVIVTLTLSLCIPLPLVFFIILTFYWFATGAEDEARHAEVRSDLPRAAGGRGQHQAQGQGQQDACRQGLARMQVQSARIHHGPNIYKDAKPYMSSLLMFYRVYRLEMKSVMLVFSTPFVN
jgi:hypothetical protein